MNALREALLETAQAWCDPSYPVRRQAELRALSENPFFTPEAVGYAIQARLSGLSREALERWIGTDAPLSEPARIAIVHPGNIPLVGWEDLVAAVLMGHAVWSRPSRRNRALLMAFVQDWRRRVPGLPVRWIEDLEEALPGVDGLIASGSDETVRLLRQLALKVGLGPERLLLRGHRFAVAWCEPDCAPEDLFALARDSWLYEGRGCRSVAVIWAPAGLDPGRFWEAYRQFRALFPAPQAAIEALRGERALYEALRPWLPGLWSDPAGLLSVGPPEPRRPGHVRWTLYSRPEEVLSWLEAHRDRIQVVVAQRSPPTGWEPMWARPGEAQCPPLDWRPDGVDTIAWLRAIKPRICSDRESTYAR